MTHDEENQIYADLPDGMARERIRCVAICEDKARGARLVAATIKARGGEFSKVTESELMENIADWLEMAASEMRKESQ